MTLGLSYPRVKNQESEHLADVSLPAHSPGGSSRRERRKELPDTVGLSDTIS